MGQKCPNPGRLYETDKGMVKRGDRGIGRGGVKEMGRRGVGEMGSRVNVRTLLRYLGKTGKVYTE
jgi:hypothetical protein